MDIDRGGGRFRRIQLCVQQLSGACSLGEVGTLLVDHTSEAVAASCAGVWLQHADDRLELLHSRGFASGFVEALGRRPLGRGEEGSSHITSLSVALRSLSQGALILFFIPLRPIDPDQALLLETLLQIGALVLDRCLVESDLMAQRRLYEHGKRLAAQAQELQQLTAQLSRSQSVAQVAELVVACGLRVLAATHGSFWLRSETDSGALALHVVNPSQSVTAPVATAIRTGTAEWVEWPMAMVCVPLMVEARAIGALVFAFAEDHVFAESERVFVPALALQSAQAVERSRLYTSLRDSEERFRTAQEMSLQAFSILESVRSTEGPIVDFRWVFRNVAAMSIADRHTELLGRRLLDILPDAHESDLFERLVSVVETGIPQQFELSHIRNGQRRSFWMFASRLRDGVALSFADIAARKRAERERTALIEAGTILASSLDYKTTLDRVAQLAIPDHADWCFVDLIEKPGTFDRVAVAHGPSYGGAIAERLRRRYEVGQSAQGLDSVLSLGQPSLICMASDERLAQSTQDPEYLDILHEIGVRSLISVPMIARGRIMGALTVLSCIRAYEDTDLRFAQELARSAALAIDNALLYASERHARDEAETANRLKDEFLATMSHELRTPLTAILGWSFMLRTKKDHDAAFLERGMAAVERNARSQARLIDDVLDVSRIVSGKLRLNFQEVDLVTVVHAVADVVRPAVDAKGLTLQLELGDGPARVWGDPDRLQQIAWNLAINAVKFTSSGGRIEIRLQRSEGEYELTVHDTGKGVPRAFLPHMFERFRQADSSTTRAHGGLGLGLAIVRHLVELHGGSVRAESPGEGQGASFIVSLPFGISDLARAVQPASIVPPLSHPEISAQALSNQKILLVDDDPDSLELLREVIESHGAVVRTARSAAEAMDLITAEHPVLMVSDIGMPGQDGYDLLKLIHRLQPKPTFPVMALTAYAREEDRVKALSCGFSAHMAKPVDPQELVRRLCALVSQTV